MNLPRYWAKGSASRETSIAHPASQQPIRSYACWGWSSISVEDAQRKGTERADAVLLHLESGKRPDAYLYGDRPQRELQIEHWGSEDDPNAVVTMNAYGCNVLNTSRLMFIDQDFEFPSGFFSFFSFLSGLLGKPKAPSISEQQEAGLTAIQILVGQQSALGVRAYRTFAGMRYLFTRGAYDPTSESTHELMRGLGADPLYLRLCKLQECFRARLTPKPWRCGFHALQTPYPWENASQEKAVKAWLDEYEKQSSDYATCQFLGHFGNTSMDNDTQELVTYHDKMTRAESSMALA